MTEDERASQLSAMFDGELPPAECELLARRLARDEGLRRQWGSYALIGAAVRGEPLASRGVAGARLDLAARVGRALEQPATDTGTTADEDVGGSADGSSPQTRAPRMPRWAVPLSGAGLVAGVAAAALLWLRVDAPGASAVANVVPTVRVAPAAEVVIPAPLPRAAAPVASTKAAPAAPAAESYTVPPPPVGTGPLVGGASLANFLVAHSEVSMPMLRRNALSALVTGTAEPIDPAELLGPGMAPAAAAATDGAER